jgi:hypothetical protein
MEVGGKKDKINDATYRDNLGGHNALSRNITLEGIDLAVLGITKVVYFCNNLVKVRDCLEKPTVD